MSVNSSFPGPGPNEQPIERSHLGGSELREMRQLRDENRKLKTLVADLTLDKHILQEALGKKW